LVQNPVDEISIKRVINAPKRGIGNKTIEKLDKVAQVRNESLFDVIKDEEIIEGMSAKAGKGLYSFASVIVHYQEEKNHMKVSELYEALLKDTGYLNDLESQDTVESRSRIENLQEFKSVIYDFEHENEEGNLFEFLEKISLMTDIDNYDATEDAVLLMTLHSAKGLEFPVVFMPGMEEGLFPGRRSFESMDGLEEERRLCYVGITRAREKLYLTHSEQRMLYGRPEFLPISMFISEIEKDLFEDSVNEKEKFATSIRNDSFSPFEQMKYLKTKRDNIIQKSNLKTGDKVRHKKFGQGIIISVNAKDSSDTATIAFENIGIKNLALDIAPLEKIE